MKGYLLTSESVTEGHPDKLCDQVSDSILDAIMQQDPFARVACETATTTNLVVLLGEITTSAKVDYEKIARETIIGIGYDDDDLGLDGNNCEIKIALGTQSADIKAGVDTSLESRKGASEKIGAGDQGMMIGYASNESEDYMPLPISISHSITRKMAELRKNNNLDWIRPDGKSQITFEYDTNGKPIRINTVVISTQHNPNISQEEIKNLSLIHISEPTRPY